MLKVNQSSEDFDKNNHRGTNFGNRKSEEFHLNDFGRTYNLTHEIAHALGLAHPESCGIDKDKVDSITEEGTLDELPNEKGFNKPREYDKIALRALYGVRGE